MTLLERMTNAKVVGVPLPKTKSRGDFNSDLGSKSLLLMWWRSRGIIGLRGIRLPS